MDGLNRLIGPELSEGLLGDLAESFFDQYGRFGRRRAQFWLAYEMGRSLPGVAILAVRQSSQRRLRMDPALLSRQTRRLALLGLLVMLPTLLFVASGVLFSLVFPACRWRWNRYCGGSIVRRSFWAALAWVWH